MALAALAALVAVGGAGPTRARAWPAGTQPWPAGTQPRPAETQPRPAEHRAGTSAEAARALAERHVPVVAVRRQTAECGPGEPFAPAPVASVLGRAGVRLVGPDGTVVDAPTAADLFGRGPGWHLDLPGRALRPGCDYERWWRSIAADLRPTVYARVATDPDHPGRLALQYWLWWVYNDWNDRHEGDWEMVQLVFDASDPAAALAAAPVLAVYAQHEGGQFARWEDQVRRDGDRPVVFVAAGSHAAYFSDERWFGASAQAGFGCDDTRPPAARVDPDVVMLPDLDSITGADDPFAWLAFRGRWGEKAPAFNNGPEGPAAKTPWAAPLAWVSDEGRPSAVELPPLGTPVTDFFCAAAERGSLLFLALLASPLATGASLTAAVGGLVVLVRRTRWRPNEPLPVDEPRRVGQLLVAALRLQRRWARVYAGLGATVVAGGLLSTAVQLVVYRWTGLGEVVDVVNEESVRSVPLALLAGALVAVPVHAVVLAGSAAVVGELARGRTPGLGRAVRAALASPGGAGYAAAAPVAVGLGSAVAVGLPLVAWLGARWAVTVPAAVAGRRSLTGAMRRSAELTSGHRWRAVGVLAVTSLAVSVVAPLAGTLVLLGTGAGFRFVNAVSALLAAVLVPWSGTVVALFHCDLVARARRAGTRAADEAALTSP